MLAATAGREFPSATLARRAQVVASQSWYVSRSQLVRRANPGDERLDGGGLLGYERAAARSS